jgi:tripartite-type tricarboxylate transporter receptor subunit TctC
MLPHIRSGKVKPIAVGSRQRVPQLPDVPTLSETYPGFEQISGSASSRPPERRAK